MPLVADALADDVGLSTTLNEPWVAAWLGYGVGIHAPGRKEPDMAALAVHHLLSRPRQATEVLRAKTKNPWDNPQFDADGPGQRPPTGRERSRRGGRVHRTVFLVYPLFKGQYPDDVRPASAHGPVPGAIEAGDLAAISQPVDFLGVNYYSTNVDEPNASQLLYKAQGYFNCPPAAPLSSRPMAPGGGAAPTWSGRLPTGRSTPRG